MGFSRALYPKDHGSSIAAGGVAQIAIAKDEWRSYALLQNTSSENMRFKVGAVPALTATTGFLLLPGGLVVWEENFVFTDDIWVIAPTTGSTFAAGSSH